MTTPAPIFSFDRVVSAVEKVKARLLKATQALEKAGIAYAVAGGNAVATWVASVDEAAVRNTPGVEIVIRRADVPLAVNALEEAGFTYRHNNGLGVFLDDTSVRDSVRIGTVEQFDNRLNILPEADLLRDAVRIENYNVLSLESLVAYLLFMAAARDESRLYLRDLLDVGLIDESWKAKYPTELAARLQLLIDTPEG